MRRLTVLILLMAVMAFTSCRQEVNILIDSEEKAAFIEHTDPGYYPSGVPHFIFRDSLHQKAINNSRGMIRFQTNEQDSCLNLVFEYIPRNVGVNIVTELDYSDPQTHDTGTLMMECTMVTSTRLWFWDSKSKIGVIIPTE